MSFVRTPFVNRKSLLAMAVVMAATGGLSGCGKGKKEDTRQERAVIVKVYGAGTDKYGNATMIRDGVWKRPGNAVTAVTPTDGLSGSTSCDQPYLESGQVLPVDQDSLCYVTGYSNGTKVGTACTVYAGVTQYSSLLGTFQVEFINNSTKKTQNLLLDDMGINIRIFSVAADGSEVEVWNLTRDNLDYQDWQDEIGHLTTEDSGNTCKLIAATSDSLSLPSAVVFDNTGEGYKTTLPPAYTYTLTFKWDGRYGDHRVHGDPVPAGTYKAYFDVSLKDGDTNIAWENPEPVVFTVAD